MLYPGGGRVGVLILPPTVVEPKAFHFEMRFKWETANFIFGSKGERKTKRKEKTTTKKVVL